MDFMIHFFFLKFLKSESKMVVHCVLLYLSDELLAFQSGCGFRIYLAQVLLVVSSWYYLVYVSSMKTVPLEVAFLMSSF